MSEFERFISLPHSPIQDAMLALETNLPGFDHIRRGRRLGDSVGSSCLVADIAKEGHSPA